MSVVALRQPIISRVQQLYAIPRPVSDRLKTFIRQRAAELGFDVCRFASAADAWPAGERLRRFVHEGRHGDMEWMETTLDRRQHPTAMWDEAKTAIVLGMNYGLSLIHI